jgi:hypothetical protein
MTDKHLTIRLATPDDARTLRVLAELDSSRQLTGHVLLAELDGVPSAAVALESGSVIADPFERTDEAVRMLRLRRYHVMRQGSDLTNARALLRRLAPTHS